MEVCFLASGAELTVLAPDEFEGKTAKAVKQVLASKIPGFADDFLCSQWKITNLGETDEGNNCVFYFLRFLDSKSKD